MSVRQSCHLLGCSKPHLYKLINDGHLRLVKLGGASRIPTADLKRLVGAEVTS